jgi:hypothetical protein
MGGMAKCFCDKSFDVDVTRPVEDPVPVFAGLNEPTPAELGQVLGHRSGLRVDMLGELVDGVFAMKQRLHDAQSGRVGKQLQDADGLEDLLFT